MKYITEKCTSVSGGLVEEMGRQLFFNQVLFIFLFNKLFLFVDKFICLFCFALSLCLFPH